MGWYYYGLVLFFSMLTVTDRMAFEGLLTQLDPAGLLTGSHPSEIPGQRSVKMTDT